MNSTVTTARETREERDFLGEKDIPADAYWGVHTARALENFPISEVPIGMVGDLVRELLQRRVAESVTLVTALNPIIGYQKAALIAKTALATGGTIADVAQSLGIMSAAEMQALLVPERLTQPIRVLAQ